MTEPETPAAPRELTPKEQVALIVEQTRTLSDEDMRELILALQKALSNR